MIFRFWDFWGLIQEKVWHYHYCFECYIFQGWVLKIPFVGKFGPQNKIVSWRWNLVLRLIQIYRIQCWCSLFLCVRPEISYLGKFSQKKIKIVSLSLNLVPRQILICRSKRWCFLSLFLTGDTLLGKFGSKTQNLFPKWNFITRLIPMSRIQCWCYFILF